MRCPHTLTPNYGRDYKSRAAVQADLDADKDFRVAGGPATNRADLIGLGYTSVNIRYARLTKIAEFSLTKE